MDISKDIKFGPHVFRIRKQKDGFAGIIVGQHEAPVFGGSASEVNALLVTRSGEQTVGFIGLDGARKRFLDLFRDGFSDPKYIGDLKDKGERAYKLAASAQLRDSLPIIKLDHQADAGLVALKVVQQTNLLDRFSKARLSDVLRGPRAVEFLQIAGRFTEGDIAASCADLNSNFQEARVNSWVCLTYFPFLWKPDRHMFLKPDFTRAFAERIGHRFQHDYVPQPNLQTYNSLLQMTETVRLALSDMQPQDNIDIHSFMWAAVKYRDSDVGR
ncbi:MAG: hypothetical protein B7Z31_12020 [Rhodobacterales bacterium 12-65-15]|nr:MAG: hypothetical protein B7Z31_12020 [Rhodobacterales bacterium 12-65-15]